MLERVRKLFERIQRENEERQIQSSVTYNLRRAEEFNNKAGISLKLGVSVDDKELFESLLAVSIMEKETKITLTLSEKSVTFFKNSAEKHGASYQAMIRRLIDYYVANQI